MIPFYDTVSEESAACENGRVSGGARFGKQGECIDTHDFCARRGRQKCLLGSLPKPGISGHFVPKSAAQAPYICVTVAYRSCSLFFLPVRQAQQMVNVCLDRHGLPHFPLRFPVLGVQFLFPCCQSAALSFSASIFGSFAPPSSSFMAAFAAR